MARFLPSHVHSASQAASTEAAAGVETVAQAADTVASVMADTAASVSADTAASTIGTVRDRAAELTSIFSAADLMLVALVLAVTYLLIRAGSWLAMTLGARLPRHRLLLMQVVPVYRILLWLLGVYVIVVGIFSPSRESLIAFAATAGIGIGFAAQDVLRNIFGGVLIVIDRPFQVGDLINIGDVHGEVVAIGLRATRILTRDDSVVSVPNSEIVSQPVINSSGGALNTSVIVDLFLPANVDTIEVRRIGHEAAATSPYTLMDEPISVGIGDVYQDGFLTRLRIKAHVYDHRLENAFISDVTERAKRAFLEAGLVPDTFTWGRRGRGMRAEFDGGAGEGREATAARAIAGGES